MNIETKQEVVFAENGKLVGIEGYDKYKVRDYFGTFHPYHNFDVIYFSNDSSVWKDYNWVFSGKELILTEFIPDWIKITDEDGNSYEDYYDYTLGKEKIRLKKVE